MWRRWWFITAKRPLQTVVYLVCLDFILSAVKSSVPTHVLLSLFVFVSCSASAVSAFMQFTCEAANLANDNRCSILLSDETKMLLPDKGHPFSKIVALKIVHLGIETWPIHVRGVY